MLKQIKHVGQVGKFKQQKATMKKEKAPNTNKLKTPTNQTNNQTVKSAKD